MGVSTDVSYGEKFARLWNEYGRLQKSRFRWTLLWFALSISAIGLWGFVMIDRLSWDSGRGVLCIASAILSVPSFVRVLFIGRAIGKMKRKLKMS